MMVPVPLILQVPRLSYKETITLKVGFLQLLQRLPFQQDNSLLIGHGQRMTALHLILPFTSMEVWLPLRIAAPIRNKGHFQ